MICDKAGKQHNRSLQYKCGVTIASVKENHPNERLGIFVAVNAHIAVF
jgi:hypothetical protein